MPIYYLIIVLAVFILLVALPPIIVLSIVFSQKKKRMKNRLNGNGWIMALGGKENIKEVTAIGSRLVVNLVNKEAMDREILKELGASSVIVMSNKVTLVIEGKAEQVANSILNSLK